MCSDNANLSFDDFDNICRLCLGRENLKNIFELRCDKIVRDITRIEVRSDDKLPRNVCSECRNKIEEYLSFISLCFASDLKLKIVEIDSSQCCDDEKSGDLETISATPLKRGCTVNVVDLDHNYFQPLKEEEEFQELECSGDTLETDDVNSSPVEIFQEPEIYVSCEKSEETENKQEEPSKARNIKCLHCNFYTHCKEKLERHNRARHYDKFNFDLIVCHVCAKTFKYEKGLKKHLRTHENTSGFICEQCGQYFPRKKSLALHMRIHSKDDSCVATLRGKDKQYPCTECPKVLTSNKSLQFHLSRQHGIEIKNKFSCKRCPLEFQHYFKLKHHFVKTHQKQLTCEHCARTCTSHAMFKAHLRVHTKERPYICSICGMSFRQSGHLRTHLISVHQGGQNLKCKYCNKIFTYKGNLVVHERLHTGERPYTCHVCHEGFTNASTRKKHVYNRHGEGEVRRITQFVGHGPITFY